MEWLARPQSIISATSPANRWIPKMHSYSGPSGEGGSGNPCKRPGCLRLRHFSGGIQHDYCGRTHANEAAQRGLAPLRRVCNLSGCHKPVYVEPKTQRVHDFCSKTHADQAISNGLHPTSNRSLTHQSTQCEADVGMRCALPGCSARRSVEPATGRMYDYCSLTHAKRAQEKGIVPPPFNFQAAGAGAFNHTFGGRPGSDSEDYSISSLNKAHYKFTDLKSQFLKNWEAKGGAPTVQRIWQIRNKSSCFNCYRQYKEEVARSSRSANEQRRFHGTTMKCRFVIDEGQRVRATHAHDVAHPFSNATAPLFEAVLRRRLCGVHHHRARLRSRKGAGRAAHAEF